MTGATLDRRAFVERLVEFATELDPNNADNRKKRRQFVEKLVAFALRIGEPAHDAAAELEPFKRLIMPHKDRLMRVLVGAQALRHKYLGAEARVAIEALSAPADLLGLLEQTRSETAHTRLLAKFFDSSPMAPFPELGSLCGQRFETLLAERIRAAGGQPPNLALEEASTRAELGLASGARVDVAIFGRRSVVFIEAKIDAEERESQLDDYGAALEASYPDREQLLVFLTARAGQHSSTTRQHVHITFRDILLVLLPIASCAQRGALELRLYLKSIAVHLYGVAAAGPFNEWPLQTQRACLDLLEKTGVSDAE
jgi:hypothetical protein